MIRDWSRADRSATLDCFLLPLPADERIEPEVDEARGAGAILERIAAAVITYANGTAGQRVCGRDYPRELGGGHDGGRRR